MEIDDDDDARVEGVVAVVIVWADVVREKGTDGIDDGSMAADGARLGAGGGGGCPERW